VVLLATSFAWGYGMTGYGSRRYRDFIDAAGSRLEPSLRQALRAALRDPCSPDPIAGYAQLYGGCDPDHRAQAGQQPWSRLRRFGPAFFTNFLYFAVPGALILDNRLANAVHERSQLRHLVRSDGRSVAGHHTVMRCTSIGCGRQHRKSASGHRCWNSPSSSPRPTLGLNRMLTTELRAWRGQRTLDSRQKSAPCQVR
jgi:8-oxoguanine DNA glycosylase-like protein